jgi:hypothetical protein
LGGEGLSSKCAGARSKERSNKGVATRCDGLGYFVILYYSLGGPLSQDESQYFILIKSTRYWFFLRGFSRVIYPENYMCKCVWFPCCASADLFI